MIRSVDELGGYEALTDSDKDRIQQLITETLAKRWGALQRTLCMLLYEQFSICGFIGD